MHIPVTAVPGEKRSAFSSMADGNVSNANWNRDNRQANVDRNDARNRNENNGSRVSVSVYMLFVDFIHPPSILPISASLLCVWKILVSFASLSSRRRRNLSVTTSKWALARIRYPLLSGFGAFFAMMSSCRSERMDASRLSPRENRKRFSIRLFVSTENL